MDFFSCNNFSEGIPKIIGVKTLTEAKGPPQELEGVAR